mgnify:CR=1 FL=1
MITQRIKLLNFSSTKRKNFVRFCSCFPGAVVLEYGGSRIQFRAYILKKEGILWKPI